MHNEQMPRMLWSLVPCKPERSHTPQQHENCISALSIRETHLILLSRFLLFCCLDLGQQKIPFLLCLGDLYYKAQILNPDVSFSGGERKITLQ